ncbi:Crp/Fnr family transcriptional regulator [Ciceribacter sp. L1K23]|uniref:Crp/Fnr family transcriptional regulator n=1 Tax=Ciceribacter sp. L1K23 TaxID=2820276 RepID=UPI001B82E482|nr:Crp/Fnr family transcriptional regulator [Ciceribacter sp. L1K23]MBR0557052.1 Crp/Fnr family transcriptional regulator [Ciceribacter sp. L1K23]
MSAVLQPDIQNHLLALLPKSEFLEINKSLQPIELPRGYAMVKAGAPVDHAYFPSAGVGSVITISSQGRRAEAGMFGREGFSPTSALVGGITSVHEVVMQVEGHGHRMPMKQMSDAIAQHSVFANVLARFVQTFVSQISFTALCNVSRQIDERLARWLLMFHDRVGSDEIALTHDQLSIMLGVRRPSVTTAIHILEGRKYIRSERGRVTIRDRRGLEEFAGDTYGAPEDEYRLLVGGLGTS